MLFYNNIIIIIIRMYFNKKITLYIEKYGCICAMTTTRHTFLCVSFITISYRLRLWSAINKLLNILIIKMLILFNSSTVSYTFVQYTLRANYEKILNIVLLFLLSTFWHQMTSNNQKGSFSHPRVPEYLIEWGTYN